MANLDRKSLFAATFGLSAGGAAIGAVLGVLVGLLFALIFALPPIADWYHGQPSDWYLFTWAIGAIAFLFLAAIAVTVAAILFAAAGAAISFVFSAIFLTRKPPGPQA